MSPAVTAQEPDDPGLTPEAPRSPKRWIVGEPLPTSEMDGQLLPKRIALPIFSSDALSSVAYGPQELLLILTTAGGLAFLSFAPWVAAGVVVLLLIVMLSYRQVIKAYPSGGGDYEVAGKNLGEWAALTVAAALLVDYVLTVAVSISSGVDNIISALPFLDPWRVWIAVGFLVLLIAMNLRGVRESGTAFAIPTYLYIGSLVVLIISGLVRFALGDLPLADSAHYGVQAHDLTQAGLILLLLRAFASGSSALTGVEAISNGVQAFRAPKIRNAQRTLVLMGSISIVLLIGVTALALLTQVHYVEDACQLEGLVNCEEWTQPSVIAQLATSVFGANSVLFFLVQAATAAVLLLAANTAFNGFPLLGSVLAADSYAPKSLSTRGDRLVYSNGVIALGVAAGLLIVTFQANVSQLIQLYVVGVFTSFSLGQIGMVVHWKRLRKRGKAHRRGTLGGLVTNLLGAILTPAVLIIVTITKFTHGAWLVFVAMPILWYVMYRINRYYRKVGREIAADRVTEFGSLGDHAIVLVGGLTKPTLKALDYAIAMQHDSLEAVHIAIDEDGAKRVAREWDAHRILVPLTILDSPYRGISEPLIAHIAEHKREHGSEVVTVYLSQFIVGHWWERVLHNHKSGRIMNKLMLVPGVTVAVVPWLLDDAKLLLKRTPRPFPGDDRRGEPSRPLIRRHITAEEATAASAASRTKRGVKPH
ncbi:MAG: APC family permease [Microbacteriaceae bacterium]|nr:APC family permease [Microbacteriaceae bacterium]